MVIGFCVWCCGFVACVFTLLILLPLDCCADIGWLCFTRWIFADWFGLGLTVTLFCFSCVLVLLCYLVGLLCLVITLVACCC